MNPHQITLCSRPLEVHLHWRTLAQRSAQEQSKAFDPLFIQGIVGYEVVSDILLKNIELLVAKHSLVEFQYHALILLWVRVSAANSVFILALPSQRNLRGR